MEYIGEMVPFVLGLLGVGAIVYVTWYQYLFMPPKPVRPEGELPGELSPELAAAIFTYIAIFAIPFFVWQIVQIWSCSYVLFIRGEARTFYSPDFKKNQTFHIGPLTNVSGKTLVMRLRWRPQLKDMPKVKSFCLYTVSGREGEVTFTVILTRCRGDEEVELSRHNIVQKVTVSTSSNKPPEYNAWREIVFHIPDSSPDNTLKISVQMAPQPQAGVNTAERLWLELSTGLRLRDVKNNDFSYRSNIETAEIHIV